MSNGNGPNNAVDDVTDDRAVLNVDDVVGTSAAATARTAGAVQPPGSAPTTAPTAAVLSLGTRKDAAQWVGRCRQLGFGIASNISKPRPTMNELQAFMGSSPTWIFIAGHFAAGRLYNEGNTVSLSFANSSVDAIVDDASRTFAKDNGFALHRRSQVVLWGGCSVAGNSTYIRTMRSLFGNNHLLLGFDGVTGWKVVNTILGGGNLKNDFFDRIGTSWFNLEHVRDAWMEAANEWYGGGSLESIFRAVDPDGQMWHISGGTIEKGAIIP
ncbi:MAG: hypothetical protein GF341_05820 [candidate division Zixibacteria bacterium]|nr:hypothetical protein [candidate division Zixibacteria bacterium]